MTIELVRELWVGVVTGLALSVLVLAPLIPRLPPSRFRANSSATDQCCGTDRDPSSQELFTSAMEVST